MRLHIPTTRRSRVLLRAAGLVATLGALVVLGVPMLSGVSASSLKPSGVGDDLLVNTIGLRDIRGVSVQGSWLCYGWPSGLYHCTQHWHWVNGHPVSLNPAWVPVGAAPAAPARPAPLPVTRPVASPVSAPPANLGAWSFTGLFAWPMSYRSGAYPFGQCTFYGWYRAPSLAGLGNAMSWPANARARGLWVHGFPTAGSTVAFAPGVQGAGWEGHIAHVERVYTNGWFLVSEMNFYFNGGGLGRVSYRYAHTGWGVTFIG